MPPTADEVFLKCGGFGRYQVRILVLLGFLMLPSPFITYSPMFILTIPNHRCAITDYDNDTYAVQNTAHSAMINASIPWESEEDGLRSSCHIYSSQVSDNGTKKRVECSNFVYDKSFFLNSFIEKFDLVCDKKHWRTTANSMMMSGKVLACLLTGYFSDQFGRRKTVLFLIIVVTMVSIASAFPIDVPSLLVSRLLAGFCTTSLYTSSFVMALEFLCPPHRRMFLVIWGILWVSGGCLLTGVAYFIRTSEHLILAMSIPSVFLLSYYWLLPESPRWLLSKGDMAKAREYFQDIAKTNGKEFPSELFEEMTALVLADKRTQPNVMMDTDHVTAEGKQPKDNLLSLLRYKKIMFYFGILLFNWMANSTTYYALMFNVSNLPGSIYSNFLLLNFVDLASNLISYPVLDRFGRKRSYAGFLLTAVLGCFLCIIPTYIEGPSSTIIFNCLALLGRAGISASFNIIYLFSAELFPTSLRGTCMGTFNISSKIGSLFSPYVADLGILIGGHFKQVLPMMVCGGIALTALVLSLFLPETVGRDLPNNVADYLRVNNITDKKHQKCPQSHAINTDPSLEKLRMESTRI